MKTNRNPKNDHDFLTNMPQEMMIDILSRLPTRSIMSCKCVCKSCRDLIKTREFVEFHFSRFRSVPCLALFQRRISKPFKILELVDTQNSEENPCNVGLNFSFPHEIVLHSSANGLLFLSNNDARDNFICNPITREYIKVPREYTKIPPSFGFGVSKLTHEYKVVAIYYKCDYSIYPDVFTPCKCEVYSLKTGSWRRVATRGLPSYAEQMKFVVSLNGNLHWLVGRRYEFREILCFDLETECFSTFSIPPQHHRYRSMCVLGDCLCLCDNSRDGLVIWLMNQYGDDKSWRKEFVIEIQGLYELRTIVPIKLFKHGDILFVHYGFSSRFSCYSSKTKTIREIADARSSYIVYTGPCIYTPSFFQLKTFTMENNVISF